MNCDREECHGPPLSLHSLTLARRLLLLLARFPPVSRATSLTWTQAQAITPQSVLGFSATSLTAYQYEAAVICPAYSKLTPSPGLANPAGRLWPTLTSSPPTSVRTTVVYVSARVPASHRRSAGTLSHIAPTPHSLRGHRCFACSSRSLSSAGATTAR